MPGKRYSQRLQADIAGNLFLCSFMAYSNIILQPKTEAWCCIFRATEPEQRSGVDEELLSTLFVFLCFSLFFFCHLNKNKN